MNSLISICLLLSLALIMAQGSSEAQPITPAPQKNGFKRCSLNLTAGYLSKTFKDGSQDYYERYSSGSCLFAAKFRVFVLKGFPKANVFFGLTYKKNKLKESQDWWVYELGIFHDIIGFDLQDIKMNHYGFEWGVTSPVIGLDSYLYFCSGFNILQTKLPVDVYSFGFYANGIAMDPDSKTYIKTTEIIESRGSIPIYIGGVIGLTHWLGLNIELGADYVYCSKGRMNFWLPNASAGVTMEFNMKGNK